jgi:hypothetical protein
MPNYALPPTGDDIGALLESAGISKCGLGLEEYALEALAIWENETGYKPFFKGASTSYFYDPPGPNQKGQNRGGARRMPLKRGFTAVTAVALYITPADAVGTVQTAGTDYRLIPYNAIADNQPFTAIEFTFPVWGQPASVKVTGPPGYAEVAPADAWYGILKIGAGLAATAIREGLSQGVVEWKEDDVMERMSIENIQKFGSGWANEGNRAKARYTLWDR